MAIVMIFVYFFMLILMIPLLLIFFAGYVGLILFIIALVCAPFYLAKAISHYIYANKKGYSNAWMAWIPGFDCYPLITNAEDKPLPFFKTSLPLSSKRKFVGLLYGLLPVAFFVGLLIYSALILIPLLILSLIPYVGTILVWLFGIFNSIIGITLSFLMNITLALLAFSVMQEVNELHSEDKDKSWTIPLIVALADYFYCGGIVRSVWLLVVGSKTVTEPEAEPIEEAVEAPAAIAE